MSPVPRSSYVMPSYCHVHPRPNVAVYFKYIVNRIVAKTVTVTKSTNKGIN